MAQVIVGNLDDEVVKALERRAADHGVSVEQELRAIISAAVRPTKGEMIAQMRRIRARTRPGEFPSAEDMVREDRDRR
jgi:plasmid stability protein